MKVVINTRFGSFGLSDRALDLYCVLKGYQRIDNCHDIERDDPVLVQVVEELGFEASDLFSELKVVEIPDDVDWIIQEYDGEEWIAEKHRTWR